jgi:hypothetical protein
VIDGKNISIIMLIILMTIKAMIKKVISLSDIV